jgi:hypothetical protein
MSAPKAIFFHITAGIRQKSGKFGMKDSYFSTLITNLETFIVDPA